MRIVLLNGKQKELIKNFKNENELSWKQLSNLLHIKEGRLKAYHENTSLIPESIYQILDPERKYKKYILEKKKEGWGKIKGGKNSKGNTKTIFFPKNSEELAEFYGIMLGDGNLIKKKSYRIGTYAVRIVGDSRFDKKYLVEYVFHLIKGLFVIEPRIIKRKRERAISVEAYGIELVNFLETKGFKPGNKIKNKLRIPKWIKQNKTYLKSCIRGLFDTDGSVYKLTNQNTYQINFKNYNYGLLKDVRESLLEIGINCSKISKGNSIYITKKAEIARFFKLIGFSNSKHFNKIKMWNLDNSPIV